MHPSRPEVGQARFNLLAHVDAIHKIIPGRRGRKAAHKLEGVGLHGAALGDGGRHVSKLPFVTVIASESSARGGWSGIGVEIDLVDGAAGGDDTDAHDRMFAG